MHYSYEVTVEPTDVLSDPLVFPIVLASGRLRRVKIYFPVGCSRTIRCQLWDRAIQLLPTNADGFYSLDGDTVDASIYYDLDVNDNVLYLVAWSIGSSYSHTLSVHAEVQAVDEPDPYSLMALMTETVDRLITLIRGLV